jgi:sialate O-acetylesterase
MYSNLTTSIIYFCLSLGAATLSLAEMSLPAIFGNHMVLQRQQINPVWGRAAAGQVITVRINGQQMTAATDIDGRWKLNLKPMPAGGPYTLEVSGQQTVRFTDVMVGEVWLCSGQSNMQWPLAQSDGADLEVFTATSSQLRMISIPEVGTQQAQEDFKGQWQLSDA